MARAIAVAFAVAAVVAMVVILVGATGAFADVPSELLIAATGMVEIGY